MNTVFIILYFSNKNIAKLIYKIVNYNEKNITFYFYDLLKSCHP